MTSLGRGYNLDKQQAQKLKEEKPKQESVRKVTESKTEHGPCRLKLEAEKTRRLAEKKVIYE